MSLFVECVWERGPERLTHTCHPDGRKQRPQAAVVSP